MHYTLKEKKPLPNSEFFLHVEIPSEEVANERSRLLLRLKQETELPGFRKGFVPEKMLRERAGEMALWEEAAEHVLSGVLSDILRAEKLDVLGRPRVETLKLAPDNPTEFKVTFALYPTLALPDYKKIASLQNSKTPEPIQVGEKEIDAVVAEIIKQHENAAGEEKKDFVLTDETVNAFGGFKTVADFRAKVKEGLAARKEELSKEKRRAELLDALVRESRGDIPGLLIENELARMEHELRGQVENLGGSFDDYLKEVKKDAVALKKEWGKDAERRARLQLMFFQIAREEKIAAEEKSIEAEVKHLLEHHKNADPQSARSFVETLLTNQKVIEFLEQH
ncbi:MAG TPA: hypothetical protein DEF00_02780 [Candidatus Taylorbacteria bacterium]|nr:MAG: Trigger factor [Parcubacteria group bacterium GW2011_GWA2_47_64]KKU96618.1 MAG: Trigger factor [Parcubacteria group bacterium GW2011_GWC2_48_17]HBV01294.1 hypothetical protein [Candidatus Taylorbacteria bacterium]